MRKNSASSAEEPEHGFVPPSPLTETDYRHARWPRFENRGQGSERLRLGTDPRSLIPESSIEVLVVGVCSSGKSTLVSKLCEIGYRARACSQEHSYVPYLWQLSKPGALVYLDASLHTVRRRRRTKWKQETLDEEHRRLAHAREHCDLYVSTDGLAPEDVASRVISFLKMRGR